MPIVILHFPLPNYFLTKDDNCRMLQIMRIYFFCKLNKAQPQFGAIFLFNLLNKYQIAVSKRNNMATIVNFSENSEQMSQHDNPQLLTQTIKQEEKLQTKFQYHDASGLQLHKEEASQNPCIQKAQTKVHFILKSIAPPVSADASLILLNEVSKISNRIVEENGTHQTPTFQQQINSFSPGNWLLPRHPNSLFKIIQKKSKYQRKKPSSNLLTVVPQSFNKFPQIDGQVDQKLSEIKYEEGAKIPKIRSKTKTISKNPNFKPRKGKNQQPMAQKFIKKLSGFHYNKNYKQNRNKTLKKLAKRSLAINLENFTQYIGKLKLQINKKFTKPDMKVKINAKGQQIDPKKSFDMYHSYFSLQKEREFVEKFYNEVFKRTYVIMWKSDERLKRIDSIKIEGVNYEPVETDPSSEVKIQQKEMESERQPITESKPEDKRSTFIQCLDEEGKVEMERVFEEEYDKLYEIFDWSLIMIENFTIPQKDSFKRRIQKFSWIEE